MALYSLHIELLRCEGLLEERGLDVSYEMVRRWSHKFGDPIADNVRKLRPVPSEHWHLDTMSIMIRVSVSRGIAISVLDCVLFDPFCFLDNFFTPPEVKNSRWEVL